MSENTQISEGSGGKGEESALLSQESHSRADARMIERAIRQRWKIPAKTMEAIPAVLGAIVETSESDRDRIAAARVVVAMEAQNQADDHVADKNLRLDQGKPTENVGFKSFVGIDVDRV